jgi:hypothetical protein
VKSPSPRLILDIKFGTPISRQITQLF